MEIAEQNVGKSCAIVNLIPPKEGSNIWTAKQVTIARNLPPNRGTGRHQIDWSFGPVKVTGYVDTTNWEIGVTVSIMGIDLGTVYGNLRDGVVLNVDLFLAKGQVRFYLKNGNEVWVHLSVEIRFDGKFEGDYKIITV
ncbi:hypothetical protein CCM_01955 [Cordyceps militaris CM01]|uniref:Uncharacterized protein n=1 Tax=Cordyceps militaris (strain CM01) TaxID=983644 RepID=G3JBR0_CORMM|nr:uncharacterized protein CCM_01955 [Cordyceps militaris CM01]EGX93686.1 hypothetical protein CCM_01955 [Cordyceps militaris CM01]